MDHHTWRDDVDHAGMENTTRNMVQLDRSPGVHDRVACVGSAQISYDDLVIRREQVNDLTLGFISPLESHDTG